MATHDNKSSGYLIPDDPAPDDLNCLLVFYPDDPLYLAALLGSLTYLGTWAAWQRDPDKRGRLAAAAWKAANECTLDSMSCITDLVTVLQEIRDAINNQELSVNLGEVSLDVSPLLPALTGIQTAIEEKECTCSCHSGEEDMSITINNCNCCCGGGSNLSPGLPPGWSGPPDDVPPGTLPPDPPQPPEFWPPVTEPDTYDYQSAQCAMAHYMLITLRTVALAMVERQYSQANIVAKLSEFFPGVGWGWAGSVAQLALNIMANLAMMTSNVADVAREIDNMSNGIKCAWLNPDGTTAERMSNARVLVDTMALPIWTRYALKQLMGYLPIAELWNRETLTYIGSYLETTGYYAAGCPPCIDDGDGDNYPDPIPATGLWLVDHSGGQYGGMIVSTDGVIFTPDSQETFAFDFYRTYYIAGNPASHMDAAISSANSPSPNNPVCIPVRITNVNAAQVNIEMRDSENVLYVVNIQPGQTVDVETSRIDWNQNPTAITGFRLRVIFFPVGYPL